MGLQESDRERVWRERIAWQESSGMSVAAFCELEEVSTAAFYLWRKRLCGVSTPRAVGKRSQPVESPALFVPVSIRESESEAIRIELPHDVVLRLPSDIDQQRLTEALNAAITAAGQSSC